MHFSGPKRYKFDPSINQWINTRDGTPLIETLKKELEEKYKVDFDFENVIRSEYD